MWQGRPHKKEVGQRTPLKPNGDGDMLEKAGRGTRVWYRASADQWVPATLLSEPGPTCKIALCPDDRNPQGQAVSAQSRDLAPANPAILDGVTDLTSLTYLNEPSILHGLRQRYQSDQIYTQAGPVLIAINPFRKVPLYSEDIVQKYMQRGYSDLADDFPPHVFLAADCAYKAMCRHGASQSIIISGESGAGKTETTKIAMQYLAGLAGGTGVENAVLQTNPLLEAFGNAKTLRNNNSSRFGKLIEIFFNNQRHICGALIQTYLLEKLRVVHQLPGERNYHIFYQMSCGMSMEEAARYRLPREPLKTFRYLNSSGCTAIEGVDDKADFQEVRQAMLAVNIDEEAQGRVWRLLAAILWLGNIEFKEAVDDSVTIADGEALHHASALLRVPADALASVLSSRVITAGGETIRTLLGAAAAAETRDALAKAIYAALFSWLVVRINTALAEGRPTSDTSLSILDIYGFECFDENSFEQLCINYANERLQQQFNRHQFKLEQDVYEEEGVDWAHIPFVDNQEVLDLIDSRGGKQVSILSLLDEQCVFPRATDSTFGQKVRERLESSPCLSWNPRGPGHDFEIRHYAGKVVYSCTSFLDKNRDTISPDLVGLLRQSEDGLVQLLAADIQQTQERRGSQTVASRFRDQLRGLMDRLDGTNLHFVRCIKPNNAQCPDQFDAPLVVHQLRCCGVLEVARIARAGYPTRYLFRQFANAYGILLPEGERGQGTPTLEVCLRLLERFGIPDDMYQVGRTKLFFRAGVLGRLEDSWARIHRSVMSCQAIYRMAKCQRAFRLARCAAVCIQAHQRGVMARCRFAILLRETRAARRIQAAARGWRARSRFQAIRTATRACQFALRRKQVAARVSARMEARQKVEASQRDQLALFTGMQDDFQTTPAGMREMLVGWRLHQQNLSVHGLDSAAVYTAAVAWQAHQQRLASLAAAGPTPGRGHVGEEGEWADVDPEELRAAAVEQLTMWEEYAGKLEEQIAQLVEHNRQLQHALALLREDLQRISRPQTPASARPSCEGDWGISALRTGHTAQAPAQPRSSEGENVPPAAMIPHLDPAEAKQMAERAATRERTQEYVHGLVTEFERKSRLFEDDAAFIAEVRSGRSVAPGMDPEAELRTLKQRFDNFRKDFKVRLSVTGEVLKLIGKEEKRLYGGESRSSMLGGRKKRIVPACIASTNTRPSESGSDESYAVPDPVAPSEPSIARKALGSVLGIRKMSLRRQTSQQ